jgi:ribulose-5-phosphate 4-epimerase/fuculose-1-phosphate aldolase
VTENPKFATDPQGIFKLSFSPPTFESKEAEQLHRKQRLAATFRLFAKFGYDEGVAGHVTCKDPIDPKTFWVNPFGFDFGLIKVSDLIRVDHDGNTVEGQYPVNTAAFVIHSKVHSARPDVVAAAHAHTVHGKAFASLGKLLDPITQDACAFYGDLGLFAEFGGVAVEMDEGTAIAKALGSKKAVILQNHGLLTCSDTVDAAAWWLITLDRSCRAELLARAAGEPKLIKPEAAQQAATITGNPMAGWFQFQPLYQRIVREQPDLLK